MFEYDKKSTQIIHCTKEVEILKIEETALKDKKLRNNEYYGVQSIYDDLYQRGFKNQKFHSLMKLIMSKENLLLAYRNIKRNKGSFTPSCDFKTIRDIGNLSEPQYLEKMKRKLENYNPSVVRRKEIPKPNGKMRPLGIPSIWDRLIQQSILQVLEPIAEAHFSERSYGFRPNRSAENAIAECATQVNVAQRFYVVDIDIKGFFDEVNHSKLMKQLWSMGIRDKSLLVIIRKILKAPLKLENGDIIHPDKGTPQGGILSPLLANINLNEFDKWIESQWDEFPSHKVYSRKSSKLSALNNTKLKRMHLVRYADDFKIFTNNRSSAEKIFQSTQKWLKTRLRLSISEEKSKITNLKRNSSEFLGFEIKAVKKGRKHIARTRMSQKAIEKTYRELSQQIKKIQKSPQSSKTLQEIYRYNSIVIGKHNYYRIATQVFRCLRDMQYPLVTKMYNRFPKATNSDGKIINTNGFTRHGKYSGKDKGLRPYLKSKSINYLMKYPIISISCVKTKKAMAKEKVVNKYTSEGRNKIHKSLQNVSEVELRWLRNHPIKGERGTVELNDNRIALYISQKGKCSVTGNLLKDNEWHCHHKVLWSRTRDDSYNNLTLVLKEVHQIIHANQILTIQRLITKLNLDKTQLEKVNQLRILAEKKAIKI